jgi:hypothetical protein
MAIGIEPYGRVTSIRVLYRDGLDFELGSAAAKTIWPPHLALALWVASLAMLITVSGAALAGMVLGGLFGYGAGKITPEFFRHMTVWRDVEPVGFATFCGATVGVLLGGGLGCFGVIIQLISELRKKP